MDSNDIKHSPCVRPGAAMPALSPRRSQDVKATAPDGDAASAPAAAPPPPPRLLDRMRHAIRVRHFAIRTEQTYVDWARRFILFHGKRHPQEMGAPEVEAFLTHPAVERGVRRPPSRRPRRPCLLFLYRRRHHLNEARSRRRWPAPRVAPASISPARRMCCDSFATNLLQDGYDIRTVQELLGHSDM